MRKITITFMLVLLDGETDDPSEKFGKSNGDHRERMVTGPYAGVIDFGVEFWF